MDVADGGHGRSVGQQLLLFGFKKFVQRIEFGFGLFDAAYLPLFWTKFFFGGDALDVEQNIDAFERAGCGRGVAMFGNFEELAAGMRPTGDLADVRGLPVQAVVVVRRIGLQVYRVFGAAPASQAFAHMVASFSEGKVVGNCSCVALPPASMQS